MGRLAVRAEKLSKRYRIGHQERYYTLRDVMAQTLKAPWEWIRRTSSGDRRGAEFRWALRDVSFEVDEGEVLGIVGRNGAGKTTLLRILSRITRPTGGHADIFGRVGSLLEVGTGFHPELTGRENVYLNGSILGMKKVEIDHKFDEIVEFSGVREFMDTPVKHYSSGMAVRLAFAVAAHLEADILLVDEVLAVGDAEFQRKCAGKMGELAQGGRTVLVVSHQMNQIRRLCDRALWIDGGRVRSVGPAGEVVAQYEAVLATRSEGDDAAQCFLDWCISGRDNVLRDGTVGLTMHFRVRLRETVDHGHFGVAVLNDTNLVVAGWGFDEVHIPRGKHELVVSLPSLPLRPGVYSLMCTLLNNGRNGGELVEQWYAVPTLVVDTMPVAHPLDRWSGVLNISGQLKVSAGSAGPEG
jgi:lipopolysaccharide transport system ATP-binding protein